MTSRYVAPMYTQLVNRQVQLTASGERKLRAMAKKPMAITRLATEFGVSNGVMKRELNRLGISLKPSTARKPKEKLIYRTRRGYYNLTKVGEAEVRRAIEQGASHSKIASIIGCGKTTAGSICTRYGLETDRARNAKKNIRRNLDDETKKKVLELYLLGAEMRSIASRVGCTQFVVLDALEEYGLPRYRINAAVRRLAEEDRKEIGADPQAYFDITVKKMRPLWITGLPFSKVNLRDAGVPESQHLFARAVWTVKSGLTKDELKRGPTKIDTVSDFLRFMDPILSSLPLTAATEAQMEPTDKYFRRLLSYIARIPNHKLRNTLGLAALIRTSQTGTSFYAYYTHTNALRRVMEKLADKFGWEALEDPEKFGAMIKSISSERHSNLGITERQRVIPPEINGYQK